MPPKIRVTPGKRVIVVAATDAGSGVDPSSIVIKLDGRTVKPAHFDTRRIKASKGRHTLVVAASDYQETRNMENVPPILPNTSTLRVSVVVR